MYAEKRSEFKVLVVLALVIILFGFSALKEGGITGAVVGTEIGVSDLKIQSTTAIEFVDPTPADGTNTSNLSIEINVSITESNLGEVIFNWNGTNYTLYNDSLVLMMNFNNVSAIGDNSTTTVDISKYTNNGTLGNGTTGTEPTWNSSCNVFNNSGGCYEFDGDDCINLGNDGSTRLNESLTISAWIYPLASHNGDIVTQIAQSYRTFFDTSDRISLRLNTNDVILSTTKAVPLNTWTFFAATWNTTLCCHLEHHRSKNLHKWAVK
jgi:hypothetical protein